MTYVTYERTLVSLGPRTSNRWSEEAGRGTLLKTKAAVMWGSSGNFEISELDLDPPGTTRSWFATTTPVYATPMSTSGTGI